MTDTVRDVLRAFEALTPTERQQATTAILRLATPEGESGHDARQEKASEPQPLHEDRELEDWNAYHQLLLAGQLKEFGGRFIVVHQGKVVASGDDPQQLRGEMAKQLHLAECSLVVPFVEVNECITAE